MLDQLIQWPLDQWRVFEFGGGYSTIWYAHNCKEVYSVDQDQKWVDTIARELPPNGHIVCSIPEHTYLSYIDSLGQFDLIIIDGSFRDKCGPKAMAHIVPNGVIVLDNAENAHWLNPLEAVLRYNEHHSFPQPGHPDWRTDCWIVRTKDRWDGMNYEQAAARMLEAIKSQPNRPVQKVNRPVGGGIALSVNQ